MKTVIIGAGPAGLTAAYELSRRNLSVTVLEKEDDVGGIAKTIDYKGYKFDLGGHRFFTKISPVMELWLKIMGDKFLIRQRLSRIYYKGKFFSYPLKLANVIMNLGVIESFLIFISYVHAKISPYPREDSFEEYIVNRFGSRLYRMFFKSYTEKVWGIPCTEIKSEWAAQRITGMSLTSVLKTTFLGNRNNKIKSLIEQFHYPREGPGQLWNIMKNEVKKNGGDVLLKQRVTSIKIDGNMVTSLRTDEGSVYAADQFINTMPLRDLIESMTPTPPNEVIAAAKKLKYRDFITVALITEKESIWPDNWLYIHDRKYRVGRIQNYKNWSPYMVPDEKKSCIGMEYFAFEGDDLWTMKDERLIDLATEELLGLSLISDKSLVTDGKVVRVEKTYPVYDLLYLENLKTVKDYLGGISNLSTIGRNGMHRYNNMDHSMLTAILDVDNLMGAHHDLWQVNAEQEYLETEKNQG